MSNTIARKKMRNQEKPSEILRFEEFIRVKNLNYLQIQQDTGISNRTITHSIYEKKPLGAKLLRKLHLVYGVSIDWLVSGTGTMFINKSGSVQEPTSEYEPTNINDDKVRRVVRFLEQWSTYADDDEKTWLEMQLKMNLSAYKRYLESI